MKRTEGAAQDSYRARTNLYPSSCVYKCVFVVTAVAALTWAQLGVTLQHPVVNVMAQNIYQKLHDVHALAPRSAICRPQTHTSKQLGSINHRSQHRSTRELCMKEEEILFYTR